jgi:hypothetical protein
MLQPTAAYKLWLVGRDTESPDRRCPIPSHCIGRRRLYTSLPGRGGARSLRLATRFGIDDLGP